ncbi:MAG TPA: ABC transporter permease [Jatrophihabitans sp.]|uniref:ABC transporter permease n=1 Tax=Jatrophihabitans sp. TaxID=1932789 RepID=UPI002E0A49C7|nr:ABC transporter permease [Jatrophihabitans sp.]
MSTATPDAPTTDDALVVVPDVVEVRPSTRKRVATGIGIVVAGLVIFLAWGLGARNGEAAFQVSQFGDRWHVADLRFPGGGAAMIIGVIVVLLGVGQLARGYTKSQLTLVVGVTVGLFVLAFLCWAATGSPDRPISLTGLVQNSITASIPFVLGALAGIVCERSGVINVAIEGQMLVGAFAGALFASSAHNLGVGILAAMVGGALIGLLLATFAIRYLVNQVVLGVVLNTFALGLTNLGYHSIMAGESNSANYNAGDTLTPIKIPLLGDLPIVGQALFNVNIIVYMTYGLVVLVDVGLFRTRWGLRTRAVGEHPKAADTVGINVTRTRYRNVLIGGLIAGLAGAALTIGGSGQFNGNISSGKGFIALAAVIFGRWSPRGAVAAAVLFGFTDQLQITLGIVGTPVAIPSAFLSMLPYVATVIAVAGLVGRVQAPAADGQPYTKG